MQQRNYNLRLALVFLLVGFAALATAQKSVPIPSLSVGLNQAKGQGEVANSLQILALTVLSSSHRRLILTTSFRGSSSSSVLQRLGTPTIHLNQVVIGLVACSLPTFL